MAMSWNRYETARQFSRALPTGIPALRPRRQGPDLARSVRLLSNTNLRISLFRLRFIGLERDASDTLIADLFGGEALIYREDDAALIVMLVRFDADDRGVTDRVTTALLRAIEGQEMSAEAGVAITVIHRNTAAIADSDELLFELSAGEQRMVRPASA